MSEWQPIETAPKDGTRVLLYIPQTHAFIAELVVGGMWRFSQYTDRPRPYWTNDRESVLGVRHTRDCPPTHWMPLSNPPTSREQP